MNAKMTLRILASVMLYHVLTSSTIGTSVDSVSASFGPIIKGEYCELQTLNATCQRPDELIVMQSALYGRMRLGSCVVADLGYVGCYRDVLDLMDSRCSGRRSCTVKMPDEILASIRPQPCLTELKTYLDASYRCVKVVTVDRSACGRCDFARVPTTNGLLANTITMETGCGSPDCPWLLRVSPGQRINVSLINFDYAASRVSADDQEPVNRECKVYATIKEVRTARPTATVCKTTVRERHVYTSVTNSIEVRVVAAANSEHFLLQYNAVGCTDPTPPGNDAAHSGWWIRRHGETAVYTCNTTHQVWTLHCKDGDWQGDLGTCGTSGDSTWQMSLGSTPIVDFRKPFGISVIIILIVAGIVGAVILVTGLILVKRHYSHRPQANVYRSVTIRGGQVTGCQVPMDMENYVTSGGSEFGCKYRPEVVLDENIAKHSGGLCADINDGSVGTLDVDGYTHIWEQPLPAPASLRNFIHQGTIDPTTYGGSPCRLGLESCGHHLGWGTTERPCATTINVNGGGVEFVAGPDVPNYYQLDNSDETTTTR